MKVETSKIWPNRSREFEIKEALKQRAVSKFIPAKVVQDKPKKVKPKK